MIKEKVRDNILLSICIPTYNREKYLSQSLDELFAQVDAYKQYLEILISDNCSSDGTRELVLSKIAGRDIPVKYYRNEENIGGNNNFVKVINYSSGRYIYMMGDDDIIAPNFLQTMFGLLHSEQVYSIIHWNRFDGDKDCKNNVVVNPDYSDTIWMGTPTEFIKKIMHKANFISSVLFNRECWELGKPYFSEKYFGYQWFARLYFGALLHNKKCLYYYFPLVIQRNPSKSWFQYWPHYKIGSLSNLFEDLDEKIPGVYSNWIEYLETSINDVLPVVANYKSYYRRKEIKQILERHLTQWDKFRLNYYLYVPYALLPEKCHSFIKSVLMKL